ncbi:MAG: hypothetical protein R2911_11555 [Caldilineaceae bacterium]
MNFVDGALHFCWGDASYKLNDKLTQRLTQNNLTDGKVIMGMRSESVAVSRDLSEGIEGVV